MWCICHNFDFILVWFSIYISIFILISWPWNGFKSVECTLVDVDRVFFVACIFISLINHHALGLALKHWNICWTPVTTGWMVKPYSIKCKWPCLFNLSDQYIIQKFYQAQIRSLPGLVHWLMQFHSVVQLGWNGWDRIRMVIIGHRSSKSSYGANKDNDDSKDGDSEEDLYDKSLPRRIRFGCTYEIFHQSEFWNVSSKRLPKQKHNHIGCICANFLQN